jgi:hypothetical protein
LQKLRHLQAELGSEEAPGEGWPCSGPGSAVERFRIRQTHVHRTPRSGSLNAFKINTSTYFRQTVVHTFLWRPPLHEITQNCVVQPKNFKQTIHNLSTAALFGIFWLREANTDLPHEVNVGP